MDSSKAQKLLEVLSELMDEESQRTEQETQALSLYNDVRQEINTGLLTAVERISYENKYAVLDGANDLADTIGLYLNYPDLIGKYVIGFYAPDVPQAKSVYTRYLCTDESAFSVIKEKFGISAGKGALSDSIPTILVRGEAQGQIRALNLAEKQIPLTLENYAVLEPRKNRALDLRGILISYCLRSPSVLEHQAALVLPKKMDWQQEYGKTLLQALDVLVVQCSKVDGFLAELLQYGNIKLILATGKCDEAKRAFLIDLAASLHSEVIFVDTMQKAYPILEAPERNVPICNFENELLMESRLCGVLWYLANQKKALHDRMAQINQDLLGSDPEMGVPIKELQRNVRVQIQEVDRCADAYYASLQKILRGIHTLRQLYEDGPGDGLNEHAAMFEPLLELLVAEGAFFRQYEKPTANDHMRSIETLCEQAGGDQTAARVLINEYHGHKQKRAELKAFAAYPTGSMLLLRKKLEMHTQLGLSLNDCAGIIEKLGATLSPLEYRLLGQAQYERAQTQEGIANLKRALEGGDREAGEFLFTNCREVVGLAYLANNGVPEAAFEQGKKLFVRANNPEALREVQKYLHIAAAQGHAESLEMLGDLWYAQGMKNAKGQQRMESLEMALTYYTAVPGGLKKNSLMQMGLIYFEQEDYQRAKPILEEVQTAQALFLLGQMCEKGLGAAANEEKAMDYYEAAARKGHGQAQVEYNRLSLKREEEAKKTTTESDTNYSATYYYGGYYYYSGW